MGAPVSFDRVADRYDETRGGLARGQEIAATVRTWLLPGPVLEVGVGTGVVATALTSKETPVFGVDVSESMSRRAYQRLGARIALGDACRLPIATGSVNSVIFVWVLHLAGDVSTVLAEASRALRPGGRVVAVHGVPRADPTDLDEAMSSLYDLSHQRPDGSEALARAAHTAGLRVLHTGRTSTVPMTRSPRQAIDGIEQKLWSFLWPLDDDMWRRHAVPAIEALRALPDPDRPRPYTQWHDLSVFTR